MGKDKVGGTGTEDQPGGSEKGQSWPSRAGPAARGRARRQRGDGGSGVMFWGPTAPTLGTNSAEGERSVVKRPWLVHPAKSAFIPLVLAV